MKKDFKVSIIATSTHSYSIPECNTPEEAENIAENLFADGDFGDVTATDIDEIESVEEES